MSTTDPRQRMCDLIAEAEGRRRNGAASDGRGWYRTQAERDECYAVADAVMELFDSEVTEQWEVRGTSHEWGDEEWTSYPNSRDKALAFAKEANAKSGSTARAYRVLELHTAPEPIEETP